MWVHHACLCLKAKSPLSERGRGPHTSAAPENRLIHHLGGVMDVAGAKRLPGEGCPAGISDNQPVCLNILGEKPSTRPKGIQSDSQQETRHKRKPPLI
ncbi:hypothetical protein DPEC_G00336890 [Dallia pectoralis]|uniref:Uncharacterized protein n=1 Tax=Dallia pectoralis TaxID=75939 RepID=A0ACC2F7J9_DALPE|nr:hypothetical protein DPEC_G00336890 [Dallia pectoralis]